MKRMNFLVAELAALCIITVQTACTSKNNHPTAPEGRTDTVAVVINLDSIVIKPYLQFSTSLADVQKYMADSFADYSDENPDSLVYTEMDGGALWSKLFKNGKREISFLFVDADGMQLTMVSYDFFFPIPLEAVMVELERNGFINKGEIRFDDYNADISYLFLSPDGSIEAMPFYWEKDGGSWAVTFQPTNDFDLQHLVNK